MKLLALPVNSGVSGLTVDPNTDDLLVQSDPSFCAGGLEGLVKVYPKPYTAGKFRSLILGGNCPGGIRLGANSSTIFEFDSDVSGSFGFIRQFGYPTGAKMGVFSGGQPGAFTTIPNSLPN